MKKIKIENIDEVIYEYQSKSGLMVYVWPYHLSKEISLSLTVKYGSQNIDYEVNNEIYHLPKGMAHFLEHIKFNEKKNFTAHDYYNSISSYVNAYTTYNRTSYEVTCNSNIKDNLSHLLYFVLNPYFTKDLVEKEKGIIISEAKMTLDDPYNVGYQKLLNNIYYYDNKKYLVTGMPSDIKNITLNDAKNAFKHFYHPENMFLTVTGNVKPKEIEKIVADFFENEKYPRYVKPVMLDENEKDEVKDNDTITYANVSKEKLFVGYKIPKKGNIYSDLQTKVLLNLLLSMNFGVTSNFNDTLVSKGLIDDLYYNIFLDPLHIVIIFEISVSDSKKVLEMLLDNLNNLSLDETVFNRKKKSLIASLILNYEDPTDVNEDIRMQIIKYGKIINNLKCIYENLTIKDLTFIKEHISKGTLASVTLVPKQREN